MEDREAGVQDSEPENALGSAPREPGPLKPLTSDFQAAAKAWGKAEHSLLPTRLSASCPSNPGKLKSHIKTLTEYQILNPCGL